MKQNSLFEFTQKLTESFADEGNIYAPLGFRGNPFPSLPTPPDPPTILVNQEPIQEELINAIRRASETQQCTALLLLSFPGDGKSHILKFWENAINTSLKDKQRAIAIYVEDPGTSLLDICRFFVTRPHIEFWQEFLLGIVQKQEIAELDQVAKVYFSAPKYMFTAEEAQNQKENPVEEETLEHFKTTQLPLVLDRLEVHLYGVTGNNDFSRALTRLLDSSNRATAWKFLAVNKLSRTEADELGISTTAIADTTAVDYLTSLLKLLVNTYDVGLVFIDELETVKSLHAARKKKLYQDLRKLLDNLPSTTVAVFTCDSADYREIYMDALPLVRRFTSVFTIFPIQDADEAESYITEYLESVRIEPASEDEVLFPFTSEVAKSIFEKVTRAQKRCEVGRFLVICHQLLEIWAKRGEGSSAITVADLEALETSME
jgi:hypothetical protein